MQLTPEEAEARLKSPNNLATKFVKMKQPGRKPDVSNVDANTRTEIAIRSKLGTKQKELASEFGLSQPRISQLENLKDKSIDKPLVNDAVGKARDAALDKLMLSMKLLTPEKLARMKAKDLGRIAVGMSSIVKNLTPEEKAEQTVQVVVFAPELKKEENFKQVEI